MAYIIHRIFAVVGLVLYYSTLAAQITITVNLFSRSKFPYATILAALLLVPSIVVNAASCVIELLYDFQKYTKTEKILCLILHVAHFGLVFRFSSICRITSLVKVKQYCVLLTCHVIMGIFPSAIVTSCYIIQHNAADVVSIMLVCLSVLLTSIVTSHTHILTFTRIENATCCSKYVLLILTHTVGFTFLVVSRTAAFVLFCHIYSIWLLLFVFCHFLIFFFSSSLHVLFKTEHWKSKSMLALKNSFVSLANIIESFDFTTNRRTSVNVLFYFVILIENICLTATWMLKSKTNEETKLGLFMVVLVSYICGLALKYGHHCWNVEDSEELIKYLEITKKYEPKQYDDMMTLDTAKTNITKGLTLNENSAVTDNDLDNNCNTTVEFAKTESKTNKRKVNAKVTFSPRLNNSESKTSASTDSRNTNTIFNGPEEPERCHTCFKFIPEHSIELEEYMTPDRDVNYQSKRKIFLTYEGRLSWRHSQNKELRRSRMLENNDTTNCPVVSPYGDRFTSDIIYDHDGYEHSTPNTNLSVSNFSYLSDVESTSSDSLSSSTWPSRRIARKTNLPTEKLSPDERISVWFQHSHFFNSSKSHVSNIDSKVTTLCPLSNSSDSSSIRSDDNGCDKSLTQPPNGFVYVNSGFSPDKETYIAKSGIEKTITCTSESSDTSTDSRPNHMPLRHSFTQNETSHFNKLQQGDDYLGNSFTIPEKNNLDKTSSNESVVLYQLNDDGKHLSVDDSKFTKSFSKGINKGNILLDTSNAVSFDGEKETNV